MDYPGVRKRSIKWLLDFWLQNYRHGGSGALHGNTEPMNYPYLSEMMRSCFGLGIFENSLQ